MNREIVLLQKSVCEANKMLYEKGLVDFTEGNVSERRGNLVAIKPTGVPYEKLMAKRIPIVSLQTGERLFGNLKPSVDLAIHLEIYRGHKEIGGIAHTHSLYATAFAQAGKTIPCFGTTHADAFFGTIPIVDFLSENQIKSGFEVESGRAIAVLLLPPHISAVLLRGHGPFVVGSNAEEAVCKAAILEKVARLAYMTLSIKDDIAPLPPMLASYHFERKYGGIYGQKYGQK